MTPAPITPTALEIVRTAKAGRGVMATHRELLDAVTACGAVIGSSWVRESRPYSDVDCAHCLQAGKEFRQHVREERAR